MCVCVCARVCVRREREPHSVFLIPLSFLHRHFHSVASTLLLNHQWLSAFNSRLLSAFSSLLVNQRFASVSLLYRRRLCTTETLTRTHTHAHTHTHTHCSTSAMSHKKQAVSVLHITPQLLKKVSAAEDLSTVEELAIDGRGKDEHGGYINVSALRLTQRERETEAEGHTHTHTHTHKHTYTKETAKEECV